MTKTRSIVGLSKEAALDGGAVTSLFLLSDATLTLQDIALRHGSSGRSGGCAQVRRSTLVLLRVSVAHCVAAFSGGAFFLEDHSVLRASRSVFDSNAALRAPRAVLFSDAGAAARGGGVASLAVSL